MAKHQILLISILLLGVIFFPRDSYAVDTSVLSLSIFPEKFDLELSQGQTFNNKIKISNLSDVPITVNIKVKNFLAGDEKGKMIFEDSKGDISYDFSQWLKFENNKFILPSRQFKELKFSIVVPDNAEAGGHYGAVFFQTEALTAGEGSTRIIPTIGCLFLIKVKGSEGKYPSLEKQFEIIEFKSPSFVETGPFAINFRVQNNDPVHIKVGGNLIIYDFFGAIKEQIKINEQTILPGKIRFFEIKTKDNGFWDKFFIGPYRAELILSTLTWQEKIGNDQQLIKKLNFFAFPWKVLIPPYLSFLFFKF